MKNRIRVMIIALLLLAPNLVPAQKIQLEIDGGGILCTKPKMVERLLSDEMQRIPAVLLSAKIKYALKHNWAVGAGVDVHNFSVKLPLDPGGTNYDGGTKVYIGKPFIPVYVSFFKKIQNFDDAFYLGVDFGAVFSIGNGQAAPRHNYFAPSGAVYLFVTDEIQFPFGFGYMAGINARYEIKAGKRTCISLALQPRYYKIDYELKKSDAISWNGYEPSHQTLTAFAIPATIGFVYTLKNKK